MNLPVKTIEDIRKAKPLLRPIQVCARGLDRDGVGCA